MSDDFNDRDAARQRAERMVDTQIRARGLVNARLLAAMTAVPRERFVPPADRDRAYEDRALPTREGQTISQPYIVALMTDMLDVQPGLKVLEVGTGSGYQAAILVEMGARVVTIERHAALHEGARRVLTQLGYAQHVKFVVGDGSCGWPAEQPYDRIIVTAGAADVPAPLAEQLAEGGRMVLPIGDRIEQRLCTIDKRDGRLVRTDGVGCRFVPLIGAYGWANGG